MEKATDSRSVTREEYEHLLRMVHDLTCRQHEMMRLSPSVTREEYEHLLWMVHDLTCRQHEMMRLSPYVTRKEYEHLLWMVDDLSQSREKMWRLSLKRPDSCPIWRIQYNHLLSVVQRHEDILVLLHNEYEPAGTGFLSKVDRLERRFGRSIAVRLADRSLFMYSFGPFVWLALCLLAGIKTSKMRLDEKLDKIPERVDKVEEQVARLLKPAMVVPVSPRVIAAPTSPLHAFARKFMDRLKANSELLSASSCDP